MRRRNEEKGAHFGVPPNLTYEEKFQAAKELREMPSTSLRNLPV